MKKSEIQNLRNLGPQSEKWLNQVGIYTIAELKKRGAVLAYKNLVEAGCPKNLNFLWALQTALMDIDFCELPLELKDQLKKEVKDLGL